MNNYNILQYHHKNIIPKEFEYSFTDDDFKFQVIINFKNRRFTSYDLVLFYKHLRNINLCLNKLIKYEYKDKTFLSLKNSIKYFYINYIESFVDSIISHYFCTFKEEDKKVILNRVLYNIWNIDKLKVDNENSFS